MTAILKVLRNEWGYCAMSIVEVQFLVPEMTQQLKSLHKKLFPQKSEHEGEEEEGDHETCTNLKKAPLTGGA